MPRHEARSFSERSLRERLQEPLPERPAIEEVLRLRWDDWHATAEALFYVFRIPPAVGEEILQDCLLALTECWDAIQDADRWFAVVLRNRCRRFHRQARLARLAEAVEADRLRRKIPRRTVSAAIDARALLATLPERHARLVAAHFFEGKSYEELSAGYGATPASLRRILFRILRRLRRSVQPLLEALDSDSS